MNASEYEQLVEFLGRQFAEVDRRFTEVDRRFTEVDRRFTGLEQRFTGLEQQVSDLRREMPGHFDELYRRLERLEGEYQAITQALRRIEALLSDEVARRELLERGVQDLRRQIADLQAPFDEIERRIHE
jgi:chromosome segregation ATPase